MNPADGRGCYCPDFKEVSYDGVEAAATEYCTSFSLQEGTTFR